MRPLFFSRYLRKNLRGADNSLPGRARVNILAHSRMSRNESTIEPINIVGTLNNIKDFPSYFSFTI